MKKKLTQAKDALKVKINDPRNFKEIGTYMAISIPSMLLLIFEFAALDI